MKIMLTPKQREWINHLSDEEKVRIFPYNPDSPKKFLRLKEKIQKGLDIEVDIIHKGASGMKISGQGELDVYIPVEKGLFNKLIFPLEKILGKARSIYPLDRIRFVTYIDDMKAEVFLVNKYGDSWLRGVAFEKKLKNDPNKLESYQKLKEDGNGLSVRDYYRRKVEFINKILSN